MKVDSRIINYELGKSISNTASSVSEDKKLPDQQKVENGHSQDTIVNLSRASKEAQLVEKVIAAAPDIREDKVAELKARIEAGDYQIDPDKVADKLVDQSLEEIF